MAQEPRGLRSLRKLEMFHVKQTGLGGNPLTPPYHLLAPTSRYESGCFM